MVRAEGCHLNDFPAITDMDQFKTAANDTAISEQLPDLLRQGVGGHIKVLGFTPQQQIPDPTPDKIRLITGLFQTI